MPRAEAEAGDTGEGQAERKEKRGETQGMTEIRTEHGEGANIANLKMQTTLNHEIVQNDCYMIAIIGAIAKARSREKQGAESANKMVQNAIGLMQRKEEAMGECQVGAQGVRDIRKTMTHIIQRIAREAPKWDYKAQQDAMEAIDKLKKLDGGLPGMGKGVENRYKAPIRNSAGIGTRKVPAPRLCPRYERVEGFSEGNN